MTIITQTLSTTQIAEALAMEVAILNGMSAGFHKKCTTKLKCRAFAGDQVGSIEVTLEYDPEKKQ